MKKQDGFTLLEMVIVIVVLGILLPVVLLPFTQIGKGATNSVDAAKLAGVARYCMDTELNSVLAAPGGAWTGSAAAGANYTHNCPTAAGADPTYSLIDPSGKYSTVVTGAFYDATLTVPTPNSKYLVITITTTGPGGINITLQSLRTQKV